MKRKPRVSQPPTDFRRRAEEALAKTDREIKRKAARDVPKLVHELQVHQIELEMQNDELRRTQLELEEARDRLSDLYDFAPLALLTLSPGGEVLEANLAASDLLGLERQALIHQKLSRFLPAEASDIFYNYCRRVFSSQTRQTAELTLKSATIGGLTVRLEGIAAEDLATHKTHCRLSLMDITEHKRAEGRMSALARLGLLLSAAHEPAVAARALADTALEFCGWDACFLLVHDPDTDTVTDLVNIDTIKGRRTLVPPMSPGRPPTPLIRRVMQEGPQLILRRSPGDTGPITKRFGDASRPSLSLIFVPVRLEHKSIGVMSVQSYQRNAYTPQDLQVLQGLADHGAGALARMQVEVALRRLNQELAAANAQLRKEISSRRLAEVALVRAAEGLKRSNLDLEQFGYVASHDLQEPLRAVSGYVRLLDLRFPEKMDAKAREYIEGAAEGASRMEQLITDLLTLSRVSTTGQALALANLGAPLNAALQNLQFNIQTAKATVTSDPLPSLPVDESQMVQLFQNLIANALKFRNESPPRIHIGAREEQGRWVIWVRDNGIGISPEYFERIFQVFQRLHTRKKYPGTGIGLAICKKIVERHGGKIWVESQPRQGSTFYFSIPEAAAPTTDEHR